MIRRAFTVAALSLLTLGRAQAGEQGRGTYYLIDGFSTTLPSSGSMKCTVDDARSRPGMAARIHYRTDGQQTAQIVLPQGARPIRKDGTLRLWVKGDNSGNELQLILTYGDRRQERLRAIPLDFGGWQEESFTLAGVRGRRGAWLSHISIRKTGQKTEGHIMLDNLRLYPAGGNAPTAAVIRLGGPSIREYSEDIHFLVEMSYFGGEPISVNADVTMTDYDENLVAERSFADIALAGGESREVKLDLQPENLHLYQPPFHVTGEVYSADEPQLNARIDQTIVMGNSWLLFDDFSDVFGRWLVSGMGFKMHSEGWNTEHFGQLYRACAATQTTTRISRVEIDRSKGKNVPPGRYAMQVDYNGRTMVYNGIHQDLPGDAYRIGVWVRGNGSDAALHALIFDFSAPGHTMYTWKRHFGIRALCKLDFDGWRYVEAPLPGNGIGPRTPTGSTDAIDFPLDLSAFAIVPGKSGPSGSVRIGPIFFHTQQTRADALSVQLGYDDANHEYAPQLGAWATVQNGWRVSERNVSAVWTLFDRENNMLAMGREAFELKPTRQHTFRIELAPHAGKIAGAVGPLRLQVRADDAQEAAGAEAEIILAKPDSVALITDFESDRGYLGLTAYGAPPSAAPGEPAAKTTTDQKKSGKRSLAMPWQKGRSLFVSVDPPMPGVPTRISLMVHGDGSNVLFYPLIGDRSGVMTGVENAEWDLFLPRTTEGDLQNAVRVNWKGWRKLTFRLPVIPRGWHKAKAVLPFVPSYPLGVHLAVIAWGNDVTARNGTLYIDDISAETHIQPEERLTMRLERLGESNLILPGSAVRARVFNFEAKGAPGSKPRKAAVQGGLYNWRGERVAGTDTTVQLAPGASRTIKIAQEIPDGAYALRVELTEGEGEQKRTIASVAEDLLVADARSLLGPGWQSVLRDPAKLRMPLQDRFTLVHHDWDWAEFQPGNLQVETVLACASAVKKLGQEPYMLLGYSAYWASGSGYEDMLADRLAGRDDRGTGGRDWGHTVDIFQIPERMDDWENYVLEMMRLAGRNVSGWFLWNTPDSRSFLGVPPDKFTEMIKLTNKWRRRYCPDTPLILGGLGRDTALPYLGQLAQHGALDEFTGVNVRIDPGRISPEDGQLPEYLEQLQRALHTQKTGDKTVILTDLDWAVEKAGQGIDAFDQTVYLARATLLLDRLGVHPTLMLHNEDTVRTGFGLTYKKKLVIPPITHKLPAFQFKPAWLGMVRVKQFLGQMKVVDEIAVQDLVSGRTRCLLYERRKDRRPVAVVWRNNSEASLSFAATGLTVSSAEDIFGALVPVENGWYRIGKAPCTFVLNGANEPTAQALSRLHVRDDLKQAWPQAVLAVFTPATGKRHSYEQTGGTDKVFVGRTVQGRRESWPGLEFVKGGGERFQVDVPAGADLVLRKRYFLGEVIKIDKTGKKHKTGDIHGPGHAAELIVNGRRHGKWDLTRVAEELTGGLRQAVFVVDKQALAGKKRAIVEVKYDGPANTAGWVLFAYRDGEFPLSALGPIHADSKVTRPRVARNVVGLEMRIGKTAYQNGIGVFAPCLIEYPLNGQFRRFTAEVGVDAATEGRGSVVFEAQADGKKLWKSPVISGLDKPRSVDVPLENVNRLRLIVTDGGDGNKLDAANWCNAALHR